MARTYESALRHLDSIQSNRAVTSLFSSPPPASSSSTAKPSPQDLNAQAIPEMLAWARRAGITQRDLATLRCVHVAGTKGKGSVCAYLTSILTSTSTSTAAVASVAGKVGTYTSPHLVSVRERIQIDGRPISRPLFARYLFEVWDALTEYAREEACAATGKAGEQRTGMGMSEKEKVEKEKELEGPATKPFYFRFLTLVALRAFLGEGVRTAVVECGIGAEYDSTNILPRGTLTAAVVAQLGVDHVGMLGATVPEIAWHKAGVMKEGVRCFTRKLDGPEAEPTMRVLRQRAAEKKAVLVEVDDREVEEWGGVKGDDGGLEGNFQKYNQALALRAASEHLRILEGRADTRPESKEEEEDSLAVLGARFADGLRLARLRGRCETLRDDDDLSWFVDGAHTAESLGEVAKWFAAKREALPDGTKVVLLFNQQERDVASLLGRLLDGIGKVLGASSTVFDRAIFTRNDVRRRAEDEPERDLSVQRAAAAAMEELCPETERVVVDNVGDAVDNIKELQGDGTKVAVLATGSLHLVGALLRTLEPDGET